MLFELTLDFHFEKSLRKPFAKMPVSVILPGLSTKMFRDSRCSHVCFLLQMRVPAIPLPLTPTSQSQARPHPVEHLIQRWFASQILCQYRTFQSVLKKVALGSFYVRICLTKASMTSASFTIAFIEKTFVWALCSQAGLDLSQVFC